jgi:hypothetical protein
MAFGGAGRVVGLTISLHGQQLGHCAREMIEQSSEKQCAVHNMTP